MLCVRAAICVLCCVCVNRCPWCGSLYCECVSSFFGFAMLELYECIHSPPLSISITAHKHTNMLHAYIHIWEQWLYRLLDATKILNVLFKYLLVAATFIYIYFCAFFFLLFVPFVRPVRWVCGSFLEFLAWCIVEGIVAHCCFIFSSFNLFFSFYWLLLFAKSFSIRCTHTHILPISKASVCVCLFNLIRFQSGVASCGIGMWVRFCAHIFINREMIFWLAFRLLRYCKPQSSDGDFLPTCVCVCVPLFSRAVRACVYFSSSFVYTRTLFDQ